MGGGMGPGGPMGPMGGPMGGGPMGGGPMVGGMQGGIHAGMQGGMNPAQMAQHGFGGMLYICIYVYIYI